MNIARHFENLKVSKKLTLVFSVMMTIIFIVFLSGIYGFNNVSDKSKKGFLSVELNNALEKANLNRTNYQYTHDEQYLKQNTMAVHKLASIVAELREFSWSAEGKVDLNRVDDAVKNYLADTTPFLKALENKTQAVNLINSKDIYNASIKADNLGRNTTLRSDIAVKTTQLAFVFNDIDSMMSDYQEKPTIQAEKDLSNRINTGILQAQQLLPQFSEDQQPWIRQSINEMQSFLTNMPAYLSAWTAQDAASSQLTVRANELTNAISRLFALQKHIAANTIAAAQSIMVTVLMLGTVFGILLAYLVTISITRPLSKTLAMAERIAKGDLTGTLTTERRDESGLLMQAVAAMNQNLKEIIQDVREGVDSVARSSAEIAAGNIDLSSRTEQQSAAVVETAASMEELTSTVQQNASNANCARELSERAAEKAVHGSQVSQQVVETMENIRRSSQRISEIISVINGIAFQTNILALNAAVEAAHAGEQGKGFAVVAVEVRNLAQRSSQSSKEIEALIRESTGFVDSGCSLVEGAGVAMEDIVTSVSQVRDIMNEIAIATDEQSRGISQISVAMTEMDTTTQQNAALVEESSAAASSLEAQALQLEQRVSVFKLEDKTKQGTPVVSYALHPGAAARKARPVTHNEGWTSF
ncbi:methyl-accepting chemotaxis protein [Rahnella woolbedingensis]|uniref:HAMP domain-containing protein n=1 Tax=Rahnella woolbedingensis TaxID=1510574 RepID=A0A419NCU9_9GAMM|nr:HAMP domain-containing protein [Rahnella woolbedingensis]